MNAILVLLASYLLGSISFSYLIARLVEGVDIRTVGSHNAGRHNVMLEVGRGWGILATVLDASKGALAAWLGLTLGQGVASGVLAGLAAVLGHNYPFYLCFRGGKGVAASLGALLVLMPRETLLGLVVLGVLYLGITHSISFSSGVGFVSMSLLAWLWGQPTWLILAPIAYMLLGVLALLPDAVHAWRSADDKRDLILHRWIRDRDGQV
jgi:glycerol-3-phosphate acyltransferase PlsY